MIDLSKFGLIPHETNPSHIGKTYGNYTIKAVGKKPGSYKYMAICDCACGKTDLIVRLDGVYSGKQRSCGCLHLKSVTKHSLYKHPLYRKWAAMMGRCYNKNDSRYADYGGRYISVAAEWHDVARFIQDLEPIYKPGLELDREDVNGNYDKGNCRFITKAEQQRNKRSNIKLTFNGKTQCLAQWAEEIGIPSSALYWRMSVAHWTVEETLTTPSMSHAQSLKVARDIRWAK